MARVAAQSISTLGVAVLVAVGAAGCMGYPYGNQTLDDHGGVVSFIGAQITAGEHVDIQACTNIFYDANDGLQMKCGRGETIGSATANGQSDFTDSFGFRWYGWGAGIVIPEKYWTSLCAFSDVNKRCTLVRSIGSGGPNWTYWNGDYHQCPQPQGLAQLNNQPGCAVDSHFQDGWVIVNARK